MINYKKRFLHYLSFEKKRIILIFFLVAIYVFAQLSQPFLIGRILDNALNKDLNNFVICLIVVFVLALLGIISGYFFELNIGITSQKITRRIRNDVYKKILSVSYETISYKSSGDIIQLEIGDIENIANGILVIFKSLIQGVLSVVITIAIMFYLNWILALAVVILSPLSIIASKFIANHSHIYFKKQAFLQANLNEISQEAIVNKELISAFNYEKTFENKFIASNDALQKQSKIALFSSSWTNPTSRLVNNTIYALIGVAGILMFIFTSEQNETLKAINATLTLGGLASFLSYASQYTKPFSEISNGLTEFEASLFSFKRINDFLNNSDDIDDGTIHIKDINEIEFVHMDFSYDKNKDLIKDFNLKIKKGQHIAIVGPTGAGKTTLINVLMNFFAPLGGDILFNHISTTKIKKSSLRDNFACVLQDSWIFKGSIKDNVAYGKVNSSDEEIYEACKKAHADSFIAHLTNGYDTIITSKDDLSSGQKQLLMIARTMLLKPDIVILDEATSNVDSLTEKLVNDAFDEMMKNNTSIVIAHRLSTIVNADVILVLKNGKIIEIGNHHQLMAKKGFYYELYSSQYASNA